MFSEFDFKMMSVALSEACHAKTNKEVPVGAVITHENKIISKSHNAPINLNDPTAHAEILAIRKAAKYQKNYRILGTTLYVTLEPCIMCFGAIINARIDRLVIAALDKTRGVPISNQKLLEDLDLNHKIKTEYGLLEADASSLLKSFFIEKRIK
jgi:tRNA(adenine34) deaminase